MNWVADRRDDARLFVVHPNVRGRLYWLSPLLEQAGVGYVRFDGERLSASQLVQQVQTTLGNASSALEWLVLDECDRATERALRSVLHEWLRGGTRLVLLARRFPQVLLHDAALRSQTVLLPTDRTLLCPDYVWASGGVHLELVGFGTGRVQLNGIPVGDRGADHTRELLYFMAEQDSGVSREAIQETIWGALPPPEANRQFQISKTLLRQMLNIPWIEHYAGIYHIDPAIQRTYDVREYLRLWAIGFAGEEIRHLRALERAAALARQPFLMNTQGTWAARRRKQLREQQVALFDRLGRLYQQGHASDYAPDPQRAYHYWLQAFRRAPAREDIALALLQHEMLRERPCDGAQVYRRCQEAVAQTGLSLVPEVVAQGEELRRRCAEG